MCYSDSTKLTNNYRTIINKDLKTNKKHTGMLCHHAGFRWCRDQTQSFVCAESTLYQLSRTPGPDKD